jgi:hypothetical protein
LRSGPASKAPLILKTRARTHNAEGAKLASGTAEG